jgi:hypothetical protein
MSSAPRPYLSAPRPGSPSLARWNAREAIVHQGVDVAVGDRPDAAAAAAVAARGAAARHELLAPERGAAVPALAGVHLDGRFVDEFHRS